MSDDESHLIEPPDVSQLTYNSYLKVPELLELQQLLSDPVMHDELLFITIHQAYELWFKQILYEIDTVIGRLDDDDIYEARRLLARVSVIEKLLIDQIHILETMAPRDFVSFRSILNPASGFQSIQFREVEFVSGIRDDRPVRGIRLDEEERARLKRRHRSPTLRDAFYGALARRGFVVDTKPIGEMTDQEHQAALEELLPIYARPETYFHIHSLAEALVDHDQNLLLWRFHHVRVVERLIGGKRGTGGSMGVRYLESTLAKRAYPLLWQARGLLRDAELYGKERGPTEPLDRDERDTS